MKETSHRRKNILTGEWVQVSPHRNKRPWQGKTESKSRIQAKEYDENCYLCPSNERSNGVVNPNYKDIFIFNNDFPALLNEEKHFEQNEDDLLIAKSERGICRVVCYSPNHSLTLPLMEVNAIHQLVKAWQKQYLELGGLDYINYVQIFENKGEIMGCSNPHPHGQIWAQESIPVEPAKEDFQQLKFFQKKGRSLLEDYGKLELEKNERIVCENEHFLALVPFWAVWPFEILLLPKKHQQHIASMNENESLAFAEILKKVTTIYDNLFETSFPYSAGIHQAPTNHADNKHWHWHMHFYPPLVRSATIKKFMVGYEMLGNPQRDFTPEVAAKLLLENDKPHYLQRK